MGFTGKSRRSSVSAESDRPAAGTQPFTKRVVPKTAEAMERIQRATGKSILFSGLDEAQKQDVSDTTDAGAQPASRSARDGTGRGCGAELGVLVRALTSMLRLHCPAFVSCLFPSPSQIFNSMEELKVNEGEVVIEQGQEGDYFYVIDSGKFNVYKRDNGADPSTAENDGLGKQVFQYETGGSFGELALMYSVPRAATVRASTPGILWRTDRETFRHIIIDSTAVKRRKFEEFLESVPLLSNLSRQERAQVADCLETVHFEPGAMIIKEGEDGDMMYLIIEGKAKATQTASGSSEAVEVGRMSSGQYFGEKSLLTRMPRAASVIAITPMTCACVDRSSFERLVDTQHRHARRDQASAVLFVWLCCCSVLYPHLPYRSPLHSSLSLCVTHSSSAL